MPLLTSGGLGLGHKNLVLFKSLEQAVREAAKICPLQVDL